MKMKETCFSFHFFFTKPSNVTVYIHYDLHLIQAFLHSLTSLSLVSRNNGSFLKKSKVL